MNIRIFICILLLIGIHSCNKKPTESPQEVIEIEVTNENVIDHNANALNLIKNLVVNGEIKGKWLYGGYDCYVLIKTDESLSMVRYKYHEEDTNNLSVFSNQTVIPFQYYDSDKIEYPTGEQYSYQINDDGDLWIIDAYSSAERGIHGIATKLKYNE
ncbi:hypothetical protein [Myroides sp.]|uniref:hypothetical protein n=1 Tax=Myroides sp. TaxID=1874736 RepID=UPI0028A68E27|nr:hypothetical protein [Myroides sp.]